MTFENVDEESVQQAALRTKGSAGPSMMDAENWRRILAKAVQNMCRIMCTETCNHQNYRNMEAFIACTLVPLNKNPGVRPIRIGEVLHRIVGKVYERNKVRGF